MSSKYYKNRSLAGIDITNYSLDELKALVGKLLAQKIHGICFSPYVEGQGPGTQISEAQIRERLAVVRPYVNWVRTFSCSEGNELIPRIAAEYGLKTMVGVWLDGNQKNNEIELNNAIEVAKAGHADLLAVGNEVLLRGEMSEHELIDTIKRAKKDAPGVACGVCGRLFQI